MQTTIKLPASRVEQLRQIGAALNITSVSEVIGYLIRTQIAAGVIDNLVPGFSVSMHHRDRIAIRMGDQKPVSLTSDAAAHLADLLAEPPSSRLSGHFDVDADYMVIRRGAGVRVAIPADAPPVSMSLDVARDLSDMICAKIDQGLSLAP